ncbi:hypothetical protein PJI17_20230 [Mycobacterium kansasii]
MSYILSYERRRDASKAQSRTEHDVGRGGGLLKRPGVNEVAGWSRSDRTSKTVAAARRCAVGEVPIKPS